MKKSILLTTTLLSSLFVFFAGGVVQVAHAQMTDVEQAGANAILAGSLDLSVSVDQDDVSMYSSSESSRTVEVKREGSLGFQYQSSYQFDSGDESFCQSIHLKITTSDESEILYDDLLDSFAQHSTAQQLFSDALTHSLKYFFSFENSAPTQLVGCQFLLNTTAWQLDQLDSTSGYFDTEQTLISLSFDPNQQSEPTEDLGQVVINEVFEDGTNSLEWVELYNNNSQPISLNQWSIKDKTDISIDTLPDISISGKSFLVIVTSGADSSLLSSLTNSGIQVLQLDNATIGNGLNTAGDELYLKNNSSEIVDSLSWGSEHGIFVMPNLADGDSYSRVTVGFDTDSETDWERLQTPSPGN